MSKMTMIETSRQAAESIDVNVPAFWILWSYLGAYEQDGHEFKGGH